MAINALNPNSIQAFRPLGGGGFGPAPLQAGPQQGGGPRGDQMGLSREAQQAGGAGQGGGAQRLTQALAQGIGQVMQAQSSGDENAGKQALQGLKQTYDQGAQSGQMEQVPGPVRQTAESLLGINKGEEGQKGGGGGCGGGGGAKEGGGAEQGGDKQGGPEKGKESKFDEETLKKLEELLGKDKAEECKKDGKCDKHKDKNADDKDAKTDSKAGDAKTDSKVDSKTDAKADTKVDAPKKTTKPAAAAPPKTGGGGKKKAA